MRHGLTSKPVRRITSVRSFRSRPSSARSVDRCSLTSPHPAGRLGPARFLGTSTSCLSSGSCRLRRPPPGLPRPPGDRVLRSPRGEVGVGGAWTRPVRVRASTPGVGLSLAGLDGRLRMGGGALMVMNGFGSAGSTAIGGVLTRALSAMASSVGPTQAAVGGGVYMGWKGRGTTRPSGGRRPPGSDTGLGLRCHGRPDRESQLVASIDLCGS
jgi:hypothetical protein